MATTDWLGDGFEKEPRPTGELRKVDIVPKAEHVSYEEDGYMVTYLAKGKHFDFSPDSCQPIETSENMEQNGIAIRAKALAVIKLADFPVLLFDRGEGSESSDVKDWVPVINLPENRSNVMIGGRFFLLSQEAFMQIGISAGAKTSRTTLNGFVSFNPGEELLLGREYGEQLHSDMTQNVSDKHASIAASRDGSLIRIIDLASTNGTVVEMIPEIS